MDEFYAEVVLYLLYRFAHGGTMNLQNVSGPCKAAPAQQPLYENIKVFNHV